MIAVKQHWTTRVGQATGHPAAFAVVILYAGLWIYFSKGTFEWNAVATLAVWVMTLFIQRSNRRDTLALHAKLDELLRVATDARSELTRLDEQEPEAIQKHRIIEVQRTTRKRGKSIGLRFIRGLPVLSRCCLTLTRFLILALWFGSGHQFDREVIRDFV